MLKKKKSVIYFSVALILAFNMQKTPQKPPTKRETCIMWL